MTRQEAFRIHAYHHAAYRLTILFAPVAALLALIAGVAAKDAIAVFAAGLAFCGIFSSVSTDMMSKRIPNPLSLVTLAAAPIWWLAGYLGSGVVAAADTGALNVVADAFLRTGLTLPPMVPDFSVPFFAHVGLDVAAMVIVFIPLYLSHIMGLGFGGGDVKLIAAGSLFFGWPLGFDFLAVTFLIGGLVSVFVIAGRIFTKALVRSGKATEKMTKFSEMRDFPYAPAIGASALICLAAKLQGLF